MLKKVSDSSIDNYPVQIFPSDLNSIGTVFGGRVLSEMDKVAAYVALKHTGMSCVTLSVDSVRFLAPAKQGEILIFKASLNRVWRTSLEVGVKVFAENFKTGEKRHVLSAYLTFVALDREGKPSPIETHLELETSDQKRRHQQAEQRREIRLSQRH